MLRAEPVISGNVTIQTDTTDPTADNQASDKPCNSVASKPSVVPSVNLFGMDIDVVTLRTASERILTWLDEPRGDGCRFVVTPNVDHAVRVQTNEALRQVYRDAHLVLADGLPIIWASKLVGKRLPERVAGSELVPYLLSLVPATRRLRCFLLGAGPGVAERAAEKMIHQWPGVEVVGCYSPHFGFEQDPDEEQRIFDRLDQAKPELIIVGLGAPKQELWIHKHHRQLAGKVILCVGATIDFIAGEKVQAPVWMRRLGLEWFHRLMTEPKRLAKRYAMDAVVFPRLVAREIAQRYGRT